MKHGDVTLFLLFRVRKLKEILNIAWFKFLILPLRDPESRAVQ